jgi:cell wall-associated NlpC family hydrolase
MTINPLQLLPQRLLPSVGAGKTAGAEGGAFETLLSSLDQGADGAPKAGEFAAAELLRMEMMQSSLSLFGEDDDEQHPSGLQALESLLAKVAGNGAKGPGALGAGIAAFRQQLPPQTLDVAGKTATRGGVDSTILQELTKSDPLPASAGDTIEKTAAGYLGIPYRFGGNSSSGIDCSSFVQHVFREHSIDLPRTAREQSKVGSDVAPGDLKKGDLVFFHTYASYPSHVGIYLGDGKMIHASSAKGEVTVSDMNTDYYRSRFVGARRIA